jgi:hypothetical protein
MVSPVSIRKVFMKILFTGMASHHTKPSTNVTFFRTLSERVETFATVEWLNPSVTWTEDYLNQYDYVVVGLTPPTSLSANKVYGALHTINIMYDSPKLVMVLDHPQLWQYKHGFNSIDSNPLSIFTDFYSKRREFSLARRSYVESMAEANKKLLTKKWPKTLYPALPWRVTRNIDKLLGLSAEDSLIPINLDAFLITKDEPAGGKVGPAWVTDQQKSKWVTNLSNLLTLPVSSVGSSKNLSDSDAFESINSSFGLLLAPQERGVGVWWSYRLIQALNSGTPVLSDWKETFELGPEWSILGYDLESQTKEDIIKIAKLQKESYLNNISTKKDSDTLLSSIFKETK